MSSELIYICEICQTVLDEHHCKAICPNCGRTMDCSDLPIIHANGEVDAVEHLWKPYPEGGPPETPAAPSAAAEPEAPPIPSPPPGRGPT